MSRASKSSSMIAGWGRRRVKNEECTSNKGECKQQKSLLA
jgi:hypothetical protein